MPLGTFRLNSLARLLEVAEEPTGRAAVPIIAYADAQVDTAQSQFGGASAIFDGVGDGLLADADLDLSSGTWTMECWIYPTNTTTSEIIFDPRFGAQPARVPAWRNGGIAYFNGSWQVSTNRFTANNWYHFAWVYDGSNVKCYVDGTLELTVSESATFIDSKLAIAARFDIGAVYYVGHIDEVRVSNTARYTTNFTPSTSAFTNDSDTVLLVHMDGTDGSTTFTDDNGTGRSAVGVSALGSAVNISTAQNKFGGASAHFDASESDQRLVAYDAADGIGTGEFTVETWYRADTFTSVNAIMYMSGRAFYVTSAGKIAYYDGTGFEGTTTMSTNTWYHLVWQRSSDNVIRLFVNGNLQTSATKTSNFAGDMQLGCKNANDQDMDGYLDEFRVSNIARYSTTGFTAPTTVFTNDSDTLLLLHMDGTNGSTTFTDDNS